MKNLSLFCEKKSVFPDGNINRKQQTFLSFLKYSSIFVSYSILKNDKKKPPEILRILRRFLI